MDTNNSEPQVASIILAGGEGTRLFPLTLARCKPSVAFGGRYRLIDVPLSNSLNAKINQIFVVSQHFSAQLHTHILSTYPQDFFRKGKLELLTPQEASKENLPFHGTADAVRQCLDFVLKSDAKWFFILSGDQLYNMDLRAMLTFAKEKDADLTIASIKACEKEAKRMGLLQVDQAQTIQNFAEKPTDPKILEQYASLDGDYLASMGIYLFKRQGLIDLLSLKGDDFGKDLIPQYIHEAKCSSYIYTGYWEDIGTIASFYKANLMLTKGQGLNTYQDQNQIYSTPQHIPNALICGAKIFNSIVGQGGIIEDCQIDDSIIGLRAMIKEGTVIKNSIIMGNRAYHPFFDHPIPKDPYFCIGKNCHIERAIIDEEAKIGNHVRLINKDNLDTYDGDGIFIRDGIIIVTSGTHIPDHFVL